MKFDAIEDLKDDVAGLIESVVINFEIARQSNNWESYGVSLDQATKEIIELLPLNPDK